MTQQVINSTKTSMNQSIEHFETQLAQIRTGRANSNLLQNVTVDYYGAPTPVQQLGSISVPEARLLVVTPYDKGSVDDILKAINQANLGVNPTSDGTVIRITVPQLTEERRKELVKDARKEAETAKVAIRNIRRDANDELKSLQKDAEITEDDLRSFSEDVQKLTDEFVKKIDTLTDDKEKDIMSV